MDSNVPNARSSHSPYDRSRLRQVVSARGLCGLANDTKWNELISAMRARNGWKPSFRIKCIDSPPGPWDGEWFYHLPFPLISLEWLDLSFAEEICEHRLPPRIHVVDHSSWIESLLSDIGLEFKKGTTVIRVFGYSPRNLELFE